MSNRIILIIPAYNEESSIRTTIESVIRAKYDYIIINDGSTDNTAKILQENNFNYIDLITNLGIGGAVQTGYKYARELNYDIAIQFDADGQHDINSIEDLIQPIVNHEADFTIGSRFVNKSGTNFKSSFLRRIGIRLISNIIHLFSRQRIYDTTSGFRAVNRDIIHYFAEHYPREYPEPVSDFELIKLGSRFAEVPVKMHERTGGKSSIHSWKSAYYVINVLLSILTLQIRIRHHD